MAIVIDLDVTGQGKVTSNLSRISAQLDALDQKLRTLGSGMRGFTLPSAPRRPSNRSLSSPDPNGPRPGGRPGRGLNSPNPIVRFLNTPLGKMIGSTRLNLGKASPLIGQLLRFLSPILLKLGPLGVAVLAIIGFTKAADAARESLIKFRALQDVTGGKNLALGAAVGGALGQSPDQFASTVEKFVNAISSGNYAEGIAGNMGIRGAHDPLQRSKQDDLKVFMDAMDKLRGSQNEAGARSFSRLTQSPEIMQLYDMDEKHYQRMKQIAEASGSMSKEDRTALANFNGELGTFQAQIERLIQLVGTPFLKVLTKRFEELNTMLSWVATAVDYVQTKWKEFMDWLQSLVDKLPGNDKAGREAFEGAKASAEKAHTKAMEDHTKALNGSREIHGGGERARGAIPAAQRWNIAGDAHWRQSYAMGLF